MTPFDFVFSLFGLLLGFSLVEVLAGLVRTLKLRGTVRIGWLTPLLGLFVMVDLTSFWSAAWINRSLVPANFAMLLLGLAVSGIYYFSASMVFPEKPEEWPDFDAWAEKHRRQVMGGIFFANLIATIAVLAPKPAAWTWAVLTPSMALLAAMLGAALARSKRTTGILLGLILLFYFEQAVVSALPGNAPAKAPVEQPR